MFRIERSEEASPRAKANLIRQLLGGQVSADEFEKYSQVPERYFHFIDGFLGDVTRIADAAHATIVIGSDHGFHWKEDRPAKLSSIATATAAKWHRLQGIYLVRGAGIHPTNGHSGRGTVRQICATLLSAKTRAYHNPTNAVMTPGGMAKLTLLTPSTSP